MSAEHFASFMPDGRQGGFPYWDAGDTGAGVLWNPVTECYVLRTRQPMQAFTQQEAEALVTAWQRAFTWQLAVNQSNKVMRMQVKRDPDGGLTADVMGYPIALSPSLVAYLELENEDLDLKEKP